MRNLPWVLLVMGTLAGLAGGCMSPAPDDDDTDHADLTATAQDLGITPASVNDNFSVSTTDGCGRVDFVDFGEGAPGGGSNDDYLVIHDLCGDGHGVKAWAWRNGILLGSRYNGNGLAGDAVIWDPFGNVVPGDAVGLEVCLVDGTDDPSPSKCGSATRVSVDG